MKGVITFRRVLLGIGILVLASIIGVVIVPRLSLIGKSTDHKVHVAFGFHGNLYHSFRIDTNDEAGFGKDIRLIRHIIKVLDKKNAEGIPVRGVWDIENLFSLEEQIPKHAPDIIKDIRRRVKENNDEVIIMSYNNGLASAMNEREFIDSVKLAISNNKGSGVKDLFGEWSPYVRPQEMMASPGNYRLYQELGIKGICLYYSAITFDAFRVFARELSKEEAHNPLTYVNKDTGEKMLVIPAYNHGDLSENVSLREWAEDLHREQLRGNINRDVLIYINVDADAEFWKGFKFPPYLAWLPNTGGLEQLVESVKDLEYVEFTNLAEYMADHEPVGEVSFGQDLADGSFNGYVSWSEKAYSHDYWKNVTDDRRNHDTIPRIYRMAGKNLPADVKGLLEKSYRKRFRLESTTNFGMATPFLARGRERVVEKIIREMNRYSGAAGEKARRTARAFLKQEQPPSLSKDGYSLVETLLLARPEKVTSSMGHFFTCVLPDSWSEGQRFLLAGKDGTRYPAYCVSTKASHTTATARYRFFVPGETVAEGVYYLYAQKMDESQNKMKAEATKERVRNGEIEIAFNETGMVTGVKAGGVQQLEEGSLLPMIRYGEEVYRPRGLTVTPTGDSTGSVAAARVQGPFTLPVKDARDGKIDYRITLIGDVPAIFVEGTILWPDTPRDEVHKPNLPSLSRKYDPMWRETAPVELIFSHGASKDTPFRVLKRNYLDVESSYLIDYYKHSRKNLDLANVNNHITSEYVGLAGEKKGIAVAMDTTVLSNFAFCPLKIEHSMFSGFSARLNPFGTYFGEQYYQPTWGNRQGFQVAVRSGDQYHTAACTYSGYEYSFALMISFFEGREMPEKLKNDGIAFAHPAEVITAGTYDFREKEPPLVFPRGFMATADAEGVYFHWEKPRGDHAGHKIYCGSSSGQYEVVYDQKGTETTLYTKEFVNSQSFDPEKTYYAVITTFDKDGKESERSPEIAFKPEPRSGIFGSVSLPIWLQLKVLWTTIVAMVD